MRRKRHVLRNKRKIKEKKKKNPSKSKTIKPSLSQSKSQSTSAHHPLNLHTSLGAFTSKSRPPWLLTPSISKPTQTLLQALSHSQDPKLKILTSLHHKDHSNQKSQIQILPSLYPNLKIKSYISNPPLMTKNPHSELMSSTPHAYGIPFIDISSPNLMINSPHSKPISSTPYPISTQGTIPFINTLQIHILFEHCPKPARLKTRKGDLGKS